MNAPEIVEPESWVVIARVVFYESQLGPSHGPVVPAFHGGQVAADRTTAGSMAPAMVVFRKLRRFISFRAIERTMVTQSRHSTEGDSFLAVNLKVDAGRAEVARAVGRSHPESR